MGTLLVFIYAVNIAGQKYRITVDAEIFAQKAYIFSRISRSAINAWKCGVNQK